MEHNGYWVGRLQLTKNYNIRMTDAIGLQRGLFISMVKGHAMA